MINKDLLKEAVKRKYYFAAMIALGIGIVFSAIFQAKMLSSIIDAAFIKSTPLNKLWVWMTILLFFILLRAVLIWSSEVLSKTFAANIKHALRIRIQDTIISAGPVKLRKEKAGEIINLAIEGVEALDSYFSEYMPQLAISLMAPVSVIFFVFSRDITTAITMLVTAPLIPLFMLLIGKWAHGMTEQQWKTLNRLGGHFLDIVRGLPTLKLFGRSKTQSNVIYRMSEEFRSTTMRVLRISFLSALALELIATLSTALIAVSLGLRLIYGRISFDNALFLLLLVPEFYQPLRHLGAKFHAGMSGNAAAKEIFSFFNEYTPTNLRNITTIKDIMYNDSNLSISLCDVLFKYQDKNLPAVNSVSFSLHKGKCTILTGQSGSGKSTLLSLLLGFIQPQEGYISINGLNIADISPSEWRKNIAFVPQHPAFFSGTIEENIRIGKPSASDDEVYAAAKLSGAHNFILALPKSYKTDLDEQGKGLSGGQKQLLAITRAFLKNAPILIMDEPTTSLDLKAEEKLSEAVEMFAKDRIVLLVTHSPYLMSKGDNVLLMDNGYLTEIQYQVEFTKEEFFQ